LDESTSSLDAISEEVVTTAIDAMHGDTTIIVVAHRLATIKGADTILYLEDGKLMAEGSFSELRAKIPEFDRQATLQGL
jgi:ABC-type multidrug transport system fused ATPase/permease subunit